jgi:hypothetical protein
MMTDVRFLFRQRQKKKSRDRLAGFSPAPGIISLAGQQNPTRGTTAFLDAFRGTCNLHKINALRRAGAFGTAVANAFA